ncbi:MAG: DUF975 family protein [Clostridiales bacterium]|jgi:uncharacterized membrane protein|nr:DUF975 family protein [Clostridiales bacterium]
MQPEDIKNKSDRFLSASGYYPLLVYPGAALIWASAALAAYLLSRVSPWLLFYAGALFAAVFTLTGPLKYSEADYYLRAYGANSGESFKLFAGFSRANFSRAVKLRLLRTLFGFLWLLLLIVPGIIYLQRTSVCYFLLAENPKMRAEDALKKSRELLPRYGGEAFKLWFSFIGWFALGASTAGLAFVYVSPYYLAAKTIFYREALRPRQSAGVREAVAADAVISKPAPEVVLSKPYGDTVVVSKPYGDGVIPPIQPIDAVMSKPLLDTDVGIMPGESFNDFKIRMERLRREKEAQTNDAPPPAAVEFKPDLKIKIAPEPPTVTATADAVPEPPKIAVTAEVAPETTAAASESHQTTVTVEVVPEPSQTTVEVAPGPQKIAVTAAEVAPEQPKTASEAATEKPAPKLSREELLDKIRKERELRNKQDEAK